LDEDRKNKQTNGKEMASMVTRHMQLHMATTRLRDIIAFYGHAMPIGLEKAYVNGGIGLFGSGSPVFTAVAQGRNVPISWESPPTLRE
jgi:hypothetical protein